MKRCPFWLIIGGVCSLGIGLHTLGNVCAAESPSAGYQTRELRGWALHISDQLLTKEPDKTARAVELLQQQLDEILDVIPASAVVELRKVPLWMSPPYEGFGAKAEYHPDAGWLRKNGRNPALARSIEFTNIAIFEDEVRRMPNFALHELAHAFHHRVLTFEESRILSAYAIAQDGKKYESVERRNARGQTFVGRHYALTNHKEYFAECTEAFFSTNDFFPYNREQLADHDPRVTQLLPELWEVKTAGGVE